VTIIVTCYSWAPSSGDQLFTCGAIFWPPHCLVLVSLCLYLNHKELNKKVTLDLLQVRAERVK